MVREPHFVVKYSSYLGTAIKLVLYVLKQLFASVSVNSGGYLPRRSGSKSGHLSKANSSFGPESVHFRES